MSSEQEAIKNSYERLKMTVLEIAENRSLEPEAVKISLMNSSSQYRKDCGIALNDESGVKDDGHNFTDEQLGRANETILNLALGAENETVKLKAAIYIRDDKRGRLDVVKALSGIPINILQINTIIKTEMARANELIYGSNQKKESINI